MADAWRIEVGGRVKECVCVCLCSNVYISLCCSYFRMPQLCCWFSTSLLVLNIVTFNSNPKIPPGTSQQRPLALLKQTKPKDNKRQKSISAILTRAIYRSNCGIWFSSRIFNVRGFNLTAQGYWLQSFCQLQLLLQQGGCFDFVNVEDCGKREE